MITRISYYEFMHDSMEDQVSFFIILTSLRDVHFIFSYDIQGTQSYAGVSKIRRILLEFAVFNPVFFIHL